MIHIPGTYTEDHGTKITTQCILDPSEFPNVLIRMATFKDGPSIKSTFSTFSLNNGYEMYVPYRDFTVKVEDTSHKRVTQVAVANQHDRALEKWQEYKAKAIAHRTKKQEQRKRVPPQAPPPPDGPIMFNPVRGVPIPPPMGSSHAAGALSYVEPPAIQTVWAGPSLTSLLSEAALGGPFTDVLVDDVLQHSSDINSRVILRTMSVTSDEIEQWWTPAPPPPPDEESPF